MTSGPFLASVGLGVALLLAHPCGAAMFESASVPPTLSGFGAPAIEAIDQAETGRPADFFHSRLAFAHLGDDDAPELMLAQRAIDRSWGPSDDSVYVDIEIPDWRSEPAALGLSAALPGFGQAYAGDAKRGMWFAAAELAAWMSHVIYRDRGRELRDDASRFAGNPTVVGSTWSISRWSDATQSDPAELERLYSADREVFFDLIASDSRYLAGWAGDPSASRRTFSELRRNSDNRLSAARWAAAALWVNHAISAFDALRAARLHNMPLRKNLDIHVKGDWKHGRPALRASLERRF